jgi:MFS family permease
MLVHVQCAVPKVMLPMLASATMLATTVTAFTVGRYAKGRGVKARNLVLVLGFLMLVAANACLAAHWTATPGGMFVACGLIGVHMGMTHGLTLSMISSYMPHHKLKGAGLCSAAAQTAITCLASLLKVA